MKTVEDLTKEPLVAEVLVLLHAAANALGENELATDLPDFWKRYFILTGDRMVLTEEGWEPAENFEQDMVEELPEILDHVNMGEGDSLLDRMIAPRRKAETKTAEDVSSEL